MITMKPFLLKHALPLWSSFAVAMATGTEGHVPAPVPRGVTQAGWIRDRNELRNMPPTLFMGNWEEADTSGAFIRLGWNDTGLWIHAEVFDEAPRPGPVSNLFRGDGVEIYLDLREPERRSPAYRHSREAGQFVLAPPDPDMPHMDRPQLGRGSGSLDAFFDVETLDRGYRRTETGYEVWIHLPAGPWLGDGKAVHADFALNDHFDRTTGQYFAFGQNFNWKETSRFARLEFVRDAQPPLWMTVQSRFGVRGRKGSTDVVETLACTLMGIWDEVPAALRVSPMEAFKDVRITSDHRELGGIQLSRLTWTGRYEGDEEIRLHAQTPAGELKQTWPANRSRYKALLERVALEAESVPRENPATLFYELAREEILTAMWLQNVSGEEMLERMNSHLRVARGGGQSGPVRVHGYYSPGQDRWIPFLLRPGRPREDGRSGVEIDLHGSSGFDFTRGAFVRRQVPPNEQRAQDDARPPARAVVSFYGGGNDYSGLGMEDWERIPALLNGFMEIDPDDVHLRGHSMGAGATFDYGLRHGGLGPGLPFVTFTPVAGGIRGPEHLGGAYAAFRTARRSSRALGSNFQGRPVLLVHGIEDRLVPLSRSHESRDWLQRIGNPVDLLEIPAQGHGPSGYEDLRDIWIARQPRVQPREWTALEPRFARLGGARALAFTEWGRPAVIRMADNHTLTTENISVLDLQDWTGDWPVHVNGTAIHPGNPVWRTEGPAPVKQLENCGPIREVGRQGFVIVVGTADPDMAVKLRETAVHIRDRFLRSEWGLKEDDLMIYRDDEAIPEGPWRIVIGSPDQNRYFADSPHPVDALFTNAFPDAGGVIRLRPDRHLIIHGHEGFYDTLLQQQGMLPLDADFQVWEQRENLWTPTAEGEFDSSWSISPSLTLEPGNRNAL